MSNAGGVPIQGCAIRITRLNADGSPVIGFAGMIVDDKPFLKFTAKPSIEAGVEIIPKSACGDLLIAYKDYDRIKRWDATLDFGDFDFEKMEMFGGTLLVSATSAGRTFADAAVTTGSLIVTSPALANFVATDVGRTITVGSDLPSPTYITKWISATQVQVNNAATATATGVSSTIGALTGSDIAVQWPKLLIPSCVNGVAIEIWQKAIVRGTGYQGTTPYPSAGRQPSSGPPVDPGLPPSAWFRFGAFRFIPVPADIDIEDKESTNMYTGWCIENPLFGTGPNLDWTTTGVAGGPPLDTTRVFDVMMDFQLPTPLTAGYQTSL